MIPSRGRSAGGTRFVWLLVQLVVLLQNSPISAAPAAVVDKTTGQWVVAAPAKESPVGAEAPHKKAGQAETPNVKLVPTSVKKPEHVDTQAESEAKLAAADEVAVVVKPAAKPKGSDSVAKSDVTKLAAAGVSSPKAPDATAKAVPDNSEKAPKAKLVPTAMDNTKKAPKAKLVPTAVKKSEHVDTQAESEAKLAIADKVAVVVRPAKGTAKQHVKAFKKSMQNMESNPKAGSKARGKTEKPKLPAHVGHAEAVKDIAKAMETAELIAQDTALSSSGINNALADLKQNKATIADQQVMQGLMAAKKDEAASPKQFEAGQKTEKDFQKLYGEVTTESRISRKFIKGMVDSDPQTTARKAVMWQVANKMIREQRIAKTLDQEAHRIGSEVVRSIDHNELMEASQVMANPNKKQPKWMAQDEASFAQVAHDLHEISKGESSAVQDIYRVTKIKPNGESPQEVAELGPGQMGAAYREMPAPGQQQSPAAAKAKEGKTSVGKTPPAHLPAKGKAKHAVPPAAQPK